MRMVRKVDIKSLRKIHGIIRGRVEAGRLVRVLAYFVRFLMDVKLIRMRIDAFSKIGCVR